jgi:hypothetical protein
VGDGQPDGPEQPIDSTDLLERWAGPDRENDTNEANRVDDLSIIETEHAVELAANSQVDPGLDNREEQPLRAPSNDADIDSEKAAPAQTPAGHATFLSTLPRKDGPESAWAGEAPPEPTAPANTLAIHASFLSTTPWQLAPEIARAGAAPSEPTPRTSSASTSPP